MNSGPARGQCTVLNRGVEVWLQVFCEVCLESPRLCVGLRRLLSGLSAIKTKVHGLGFAKDMRWCGILHWHHERLRTADDMIVIAFMWIDTLSESGQDAWVQMN